MPEPERGHQSQDKSADLARGAAAVRTPGSGSSSDALSPADAPTLVEASPANLPPLAMSPRPQPSGTTSRGAPILEPEMVLGQRYEIVELIGQGGMGAVYKAQDRELSRIVALKVIRPNLADNYGTQIIERFKQELILAHQVTHKNVIRIYDLAEADGLKFITMEYIEGENLHELIAERKKLAPDEAVDIIQQVCRALEAAHSVGVIHRDLKPQNVMRDRSGRVLVMDFGLARSLEGSGMTQTGALLGTMEYMSPEQALCKDLDARSDLFSLGLIFYELLTGKMPYAADSALASLIKRTQERAVPVSDLDESIPGALSGIVSKCLERDPELRYQNATEILADLEAWQGNGAGVHRSFPGVRRKRAARGPVAWFPALTSWRILLSVFALLVLAVGGFLVGNKIFPSLAKQASAQPAISLAVLPFHNASGDAGLDWLSSSLEEMLTTDVGQSSKLRTVSPNRLYQVLSDLHLAPGSALDASNVRRLAEFSNADIVVWGQYARFGEQIRIDASMQDLKHDRSLTLKAESSNQKDLLATIDRLAQSIRENLELSPRLIKELKEQSFKPTSTSLEAVRFYNEGVGLARQGHDLDALRRFQASTKADPDFALAYAKLGQTYAKLGYDNEAELAARRAVELSQGLPAREKYLISANQARIANDNAKAIEAYENLAKVSPDDYDLLSDLAGLYSEVDNFDKSRELYKRLLERDPKNAALLLAMGRLEIRSGNPQPSLEYLNRGLTLAIELDDQGQRAAILNAIGVAYRLLNKPEDAARYLQDSLVIKRRLGEKRAIAISLNELAQVEAILGKPEAALASFQEALELRRDIGDKKGVGDTLIDLGAYYQDSGRYDQALKLYKEALQIQRDVGNEDYQGLCLENIGLAYLSKGDYDNARTYFEQALEIRQKFKVPGDTADILHNLGETYAKTGQFDKALDQYLTALSLYRSANDKNGAAKEAYSMGTIFEYQGRYGAAVSSKEDAVKAFRELRDRSFWMAEILGGYGHALAEAGRGDEAQRSFDEGLSLARELKNQALVAQTLNFQGDASLYRGDLRGAHRLYDQAAQAALHSTDRHAVLLSSLNRLKVTVQEGEAPKNAIPGLRSLAQEADALGLKYLSLEASLYLAQAELDTKDYSRARQDLERTLVRGEKLGLRTLVAETQYLLGTSLRLLGSQKEAEPHYREAARLLDEIRKEPGADKVLKRWDLNSIYGECARWLTPSRT